MRCSRWILLAWLLFALRAAAAPPVLPIATGEWPPYVSESAAGNGPIAALVAAVCAEMGVKPKFVFTSWPLAEMMVEHGQVFAAFPYTQTAERQSRFDYSASLFDTHSVMFYDKARSTATFPPRTMAEMRGHTVGAIRGEWYLPALLQAGITVDYANSYEQTLAKLLAGRVDVAPMNDRLGWYYIRKFYGSEAQRFAEAPYFQATPVVSNHLIVSRSYPRQAELLADFDAALARLIQRGEVEQILTAAGLQSR
jgi:polar amino acid transport system substrate-binding protein